MDTQTAALIHEIKDRQEIYDCIMRYCRGVDRLDRELLLSAYHSDALDDHGMFVGSPAGFADYFFKFHEDVHHYTQHHITNHRCELDGDVAHAESYYIFRSLNRQKPFYSLSSGRYLDRFERRDGRWAIAARVCTGDIADEFFSPNGIDDEPVFVAPRRSKDDMSYNRPLIIAPERVTEGRQKAANPSRAGLANAPSPATESVGGSDILTNELRE